MELRDLPPKNDVKGGVKTPPGGIPVSQFARAMADMTKGEAACVTLKEHLESKINSVEALLKKDIQGLRSEFRIYTDTTSTALKLKASGGMTLERFVSILALLISLGVGLLIVFHK